MQSKHVKAAIFATLTTLALLAGCKDDNKAATPASSSTAAPAAAPAASTPPPTASAAGDIPADCDAYIKKVSACMDKLGANSPAASAFKQQMDSARAQWASVPDKTQLAAQCKQSSDLFTQSSSQMGCQ